MTSRQKYEWRLTWRRAAWQPDTSDAVRHYQSASRLQQAVRRLTAPRPGLSPLTVLCVERRRVMAWEPADRLGRPTS